MTEGKRGFIKKAYLALLELQLMQAEIKALSAFMPSEGWLEMQMVGHRSGQKRAPSIGALSCENVPTQRPDLEARDAQRSSLQA